MWVSPARLAFWLGLGVVIDAGCTTPSASTTGTSSSGSDSDACEVGQLNCACDAADQCDEGLVCASNRCVPAGGTTTVVDPTTGSPTTTTSDTSTTGTVGECAPADGHAAADCPANTPYCSAQGECVTCTGISSCAAIDPALPACDVETGQCVECTAEDAAACSGATPICDAAQTCRACFAHDECTGSACDIKTGECFPAEHALWVDGGGTCDDMGPGTEADPLCTISQALGRVSAVTPRAILVRGVPGGSYAEPLAVPANSRVAIVRVDATPVIVAGVAAQSLRVDAGARAYLDGLEVTGNTMGHGLGCTGAELWVDRSLIRAQALSGLSAEDCALRLRSSVLTQNISEGLFVSGGEIWLENAFITDNGDKNLADSPRGGMALAGGAQAHLIYTTLYGNSAFIGSGWSIDCDPDPAEEAVTMRNSIAFNFTGYSTFNCGGVEDVSRSAFSAATDEQGDDNIGVTTVEQSMLMVAEPDEPGVYRPKPGSKLDTVALYDEGDPDFDFEGDPRPTQAPSFPGADQPP